MTYLHVRNWEKYQHYKNRQPVWIKLHVELIDDLDMRSKVSPITRFAWPHVLLVAARHGNTLKDDPKWLGSLLDLDTKTTRTVLAELRKGRWLTAKRASNPLAKRYPSRAPARSQEQKQPAVKPTAVDKGDKQQLAPRKRGNQQPQAGVGSESYGHALRLVSILRHADNTTTARVTAFATQLPPAAFEQVREKIQTSNGKIKNDAGYAVSELKRLVREGAYAA